MVDFGGWSYEPFFLSHNHTHTHLHVVLLAPGHAELVVFPLLVHRQQREMVPLRLEELCLLLISLGLLLFRPAYAAWFSATGGVVYMVYAFLRRRWLSATGGLVYMVYAFLRRRWVSATGGVVYMVYAFLRRRWVSATGGLVYMVYAF
jgi:hypothetical protein